MKVMALFMSLLMLSASATSYAAQAQQMPSYYQDVLAKLGRKGDYKDNVLKINIPRSDLNVIVDGVETPTPFGFSGWLGMTRGDGGKDVMMGDLVLLQEEVNPVMSALLEHGLEVTALHNHFFYEQPRIFYMHVMGRGTPADLAEKVKPAIDLIGQVPRRTESGSLGTTNTNPLAVTQDLLNTAEIARIVGRPGEQSGAVYKITIGRDDLHVKDMGAVIGTRMGLNTWAAFTGSNLSAAIAGDVAMLESEVQPVLKALRSHGLEVVAIHQHMIGVQPMVIFLHYWGKGPASKLASSFRAALDELGKGKPMSMKH
jgi:hypothetical protein